MQAQINWTIKTDYEYSNNPFRLPEKTAQSLASLTAGADYQLDSTTFTFYSDYYSFSKDPVRNYFSYSLSADTKLNNILFGASLGSRINQPDYNYFNYYDLSLYLAHQFDWLGISNELMVNYGYTRFSNFNSFDNYIFNLDYTGNCSFDSKTTLMFNASVNYQKFFNTPLDKKKSTPSYTLFSSYLRAAQSVTEKTGIAYQFDFSKMISFNGNSLEKWTYGYGDETLLFDNFYSSDGLAHTFELTQVFPYDITFKSGIYYGENNYPAQSIYADAENMDFNKLRKDYTSSAYFTIKKPFYLDSQNSVALNLNLQYYYLSNKSNSYWYNYNTNSYSLGLSLSF